MGYMTELNRQARRGWSGYREQVPELHKLGGRTLHYTGPITIMICMYGKFLMEFTTTISYCL